MKKVLIVILLFIQTSILKVSIGFNETFYSAIVIDSDSSQVIYGKNIHKKCLTASIAKIMTCIVAIENKDLNTYCEVTLEDVNQIGSKIYLDVGDKILLIDLLYGLMLRSGNDAAWLIANTVAKNVNEFIMMMNRLACKLKMYDSYFTNPSGLDESSENYSSAYDMAILMSYCMKNKVFQKIVATSKYTFKSYNNKEYVLLNKHKLVNSNKYANGGKTGYTVKAKRTLVTSFKKDNINLVVVTFNCGNDWNVHERLFQYVIDNYKKIIFFNYGIIDKAKLCSLGYGYIYENASILVKNEDSYQCVVEICDNSKYLGVIKIYINSTIVKELIIYRYY